MVISSPVQAAVNSVLPEHSHPAASSASLPSLQQYVGITGSYQCCFVLVCTKIVIIHCLCSRQGGVVDLTNSSNGTVSHSHVVDLTRDPLHSHHTTTSK